MERDVENNISRTRFKSEIICSPARWKNNLCIQRRRGNNWLFKTGEQCIPIECSRVWTECKGSVGENPEREKKLEHVDNEPLKWKNGQHMMKGRTAAVDMQECHSNVLYTPQLNERSHLRSADILPNGKCENCISNLPMLPIICLSCLMRGRGSSPTGQALQSVLKRFGVILQSIPTHDCLPGDGKVQQFDYGIEDFGFLLDFWLGPRSVTVQHLLFYCAFCMIHCHNWILMPLNVPSKTETHHKVTLSLS